MAMLLETDTGTNLDITSELNVASYTPDRDRYITVNVRITNMDANAANISMRVGGPAYGQCPYELNAVAKAAASNTKFTYTFRPFYVKSGLTVSVQVLSSNANDSAVSITVDWIDVQQVDVERYGGTDVSSKLQDGYPQVDVVSVGGETPLDGDDITDSCAGAISDGSGLISRIWGRLRKIRI